MLDYEQTVPSQYKNSPTMMSLIESFNQCVDPAAKMDLFYANVVNVLTAVGYGLDVWGRIVGVSRVLEIVSGTYLGFAQASPGVQSFDGKGPWYSGTALTSNFALTDEAYRSLILAKAAANICDGSAQSINKILFSLFGDSGISYVWDNKNMSMTYCFFFELTPVQRAIVNQSGVLPRPSGIAVTFSETY